MSTKKTPKPSPSKPKLVMVSSASGDWEALYVDGVKKLEGHTVQPRYILAILGFNIEEKECAEGFAEDRGDLPDLLSEIEF